LRVVQHTAYGRASHDLQRPGLRVDHHQHRPPRVREQRVPVAGERARIVTAVTDQEREPESARPLGGPDCVTDRATVVVAQQVTTWHWRLPYPGRPAAVRPARRTRPAHRTGQILPTRQAPPGRRTTRPPAA